MARFIPKSIVTTAPSSERRVWSSLDQLSDDWHVLHSVVWQSARGGRQGDGEADFVLLHPRHGLLVLEVKGGRIEVERGEWRTIDRNGEVHKIKDPFRQASDSKYALLAYLKQLPQGTLGTCRVCHGVVFPDAMLSGPIGLQPREIILDGGDLLHPEEALRRLLQHWSQYESTRLDAAQCETVLGRLAPTLTIRRTLKTDVMRSEAALLELTARQVRVLRAMRHNRRCVVLGGAGTGKTVLAIEKARQLAKDGARVLLTCFNAPLANRIKDELADASVTVSTFHSLCLTRARQHKLRVPTATNDAWWDREAADLLAATAGADPFDAVVVDEAQDFTNDWLVALQLILRVPDEAPFYLFADDHQAIYRAGLQPPAGWFVASLDLNCRNTLPIARCVANLLGDTLPDEGGAGREPIFVECPTGAGAGVVQDLVARLLEDEGFEPRQVAVLSDSRRLVETLHERLAGSCAFVPLGAVGVVAESIHRFKGLEAEVVVLALSSALADDWERGRALAYVGASRARSLLFVVGSRSLKARVQIPAAASTARK